MLAAMVGFLKSFWFCLRKGESEPNLISLSLRLGWRQRAEGSFNGFAPLCHSPRPMITQLIAKTTLLVKCHQISLCFYLCYSLRPNLLGYEELKDCLLWKMNQTYISLSWKKTVSWRGSSVGSVRSGGECSVLVFLFCLIRLVDGCSHGDFFKAFWFSLRKGESEPTPTTTTYLL